MNEPTHLIAMFVDQTSQSSLFFCVQKSIQNHHLVLIQTNVFEGLTKVLLHLERYVSCILPFSHFFPIEIPPNVRHIEPSPFGGGWGLMTIQPLQHIPSGTPTGGYRDAWLIGPTNQGWMEKHPTGFVHPTPPTKKRHHIFPPNRKVTEIYLML